jgi:hypothetical protein
MYQFPFYLEPRTEVDISEQKEGRKQEIIDTEFMEGFTERSDKRKPVTMHDVGIQIKSAYETANCKTQDGKRNPACLPHVLRNQELLRHSNALAHSASDDTEKKDPDQKQEVIFFDVQE